MCVLALAWRAHPRWRLVVAANRDEFHARATAPLAPWPEGGVIAGRDLVAGGTWLAVTRTGGFAALTNLRGFGGPDPAKASRGALVVDLAMGAAGDAAAVNPFNAVAIRGGVATFLTNRPRVASHALAPGVHAMSNGPLDPPWPKTQRLASLIAAWLETPDADEDVLFEGLRDRSPPVEAWGDRLPPTAAGGDPVAIFVDDPVYGTRCSTLVLVDAAGRGTIVERRYDANGAFVGDDRYDFAWPGA
ncbi:NRDE family protein [Sphingomonas adhaesiva]|uniref:NRDE family protein n=1 Tax=Sphingomonas adhaesiva TaxID=28212 RepID=UPI002FF726DC